MPSHSERSDQQGCVNIRVGQSAVLQLGLNLQLTPQASLNLGYSGQVGDGNNDHGVRLGLNFAF